MRIGREKGSDGRRTNGLFQHLSLGLSLGKRMTGQWALLVELGHGAFGKVHEKRSAYGRFTVGTPKEDSGAAGHDGRSSQAKRPMTRTLAKVTS